MKNLTLCALTLWAMAYMSAQETKNDSIIQEKIILNDLILKGDFYTDPTFIKEIINQNKQAVQPKNIADLFRNVDGMNFIKRGNYAIDPSFRASQYEQLNIQYDGGVKAMHACPNRMDPVTTHILPEEIDKIEIIKGPYSVRYGSNFGGVINLVTAKPDMSHKGIKGQIKAGYETNGHTWVTSTGLQYIGTKFHMNGNVGYRDFGNYKDGDGTEIPSSFKSTDYAVGAGYFLAVNHHLLLNWRQSFGRDILHAGLPMDTESDDSSIFSLDYSAKELKGIISAFNSKIYYAKVDHLMNNALRPNLMMMEMASQVYADTYGGKIEAKWDISKKMNVFTGVDMTNIKRDGTRMMLHKTDMKGNPLPKPMTMQTDIWQEAYVNNYGAFAESSFIISKEMVVKAGARIDMVYAKPKYLADNFEAIYGNVKEGDDINFSGHIGFKYAPKPKQIWEFALGRGVRSANMTERFINYFNVGQDKYNYVGNPNLKPEVNHQLELGFKDEAYLGSFLKLNYGFSAYYAKLTDYITAVVDPTLQTKMQPMVKRFINIEDAYKTGFEAFGQASFLENWSVGASVAYVDTKNKDLDESLPLTPPFTTNLNVSYATSKISSTLKFKGVSRQKKIANSFSETETPGYNVMDFEFTYKPITNLSVGGAVLNILDKTYHNHQNFSFVNQSNFQRIPINEAGRNFTIFTRYSF